MNDPEEIILRRIEEKRRSIEHLRRRLEEVEKDLETIYSLQEVFKKCLEK
ncbi:MAG: hypothetical protein QXE01_02875 [Sulfolobales archaeon]